MAKPSALSVTASGDFETIGYVQFHVVCELKKKQKL